jgi:hypothetical protein
LGSAFAVTLCKPGEFHIGGNRGFQPSVEKGTLHCRYLGWSTKVCNHVLDLGRSGFENRNECGGDSTVLQPPIDMNRADTFASSATLPGATDASENTLSMLLAPSF